ncbi:distal tail protein Dit [Streptococcus danieliae]|uniref:distal tail protein Dit n=1 Tax=Streptococcus danieliae TaxID=747656 RepID=UPI0021C5BF34|nr:distal tail protein Dit [Streptococcus danieliae]MCU0082061.1 DUF859 family phage minor structural protein [Streptococcus danieliae]
MDEKIIMTYNDVNFSDLIDVISVERDIGNKRDVTTNPALTLGATVNRVKVGMKEIRVRFSLASVKLSDIQFVDTTQPYESRYKNLNKLREKIAGLLHTTVPLKLEFSDEPDRYYWALSDGDISLGAITTWYDEATITFLVPDGVAHSTTYKEVTTHRVESDRIIYTVDNQGTVDAFPIIEVEHEESNGYLAFVNREGISALGDESKVDADSYVRASEPLLDFKGGRLFNSVSLPSSSYGGSSGGSRMEFISNNDRGYRLRITLETLSQNTSSRTSQVKMRAHLLNQGWTFALYDINASVTVSGQTFTYSGRPQMLTKNSSILLIEKTISVTHDGNGAKTISVSGWLTGQGGYSPNRLTVRTSNYSLPRLALSSQSSGHTQASGPNLAQKNVAVRNDNSDVQNASLKVENVWGRNHLALNSLGEVGQNQGASSAGLTWVIPGSERTTSEYIWWRQIFWCGRVNQRGFLKVIVSDESGAFLYGVETIKRGADFETEYNFFATDGKGGFEFLKQWKFKPSHKNEENPFNRDRGWSDLNRKDDQVDVYWFGSHFRVTAPNIKGKKAAKIHVVWGGYPGSEWPTHMYLDELYFRMDFGKKFTDKPTNPFGKQSKVVINSEDDTIQVDGVMNANLLIDGAGFIRIPPGESELQFFASKWTRKVPRVTIRFEERWL